MFHLRKKVRIRYVQKIAGSMRLEGILFQYSMDTGFGGGCSNSLWLGLEASGGPPESPSATFRQWVGLTVEAYDSCLNIFRVGERVTTTWTIIQIGRRKNCRRTPPSNRRGAVAKKSSDGAMVCTVFGQYTNGLTMVSPRLHGRRKIAGLCVLFAQVLFRAIRPGLDR